MQIVDVNCASRCTASCGSGTRKRLRVNKTQDAFAGNLTGVEVWLVV